MSQTRGEMGFAVVAILSAASLMAAIFFGSYYFLAKQPKKDVVRSNTPTPPVPSPTPDGTADWVSVDTDCGFSMKHPKGWSVVHPNPGCPYIEGPAFKKQPWAESYGPFLRFSRTQLGKDISIVSKGKLKEVAIDSLEGHIQAWQLADGNIVSDIEEKSYGSLKGKQFTLRNKSEGRDYTTFMFLHDAHVYIIEWPNQYIGQYGSQIEKMISSVKFL